jgi:1-acyl-sn-glycerol-3-phosphate acyltransferase
MQNGRKRPRRKREKRVKLFYRVARVGFRVVYGLLYNHTVEWEFDLRQLPGAAIVAPNHVSYLDPQLVSASVPGDLHFFANKRLFENKFMGWLLRRLCCHPVEKGKELATIRTAIELLNQGNRVVVFPEGTRSEDGGLRPLRNGVAFLALRSQCPIIPCYVGGSYEAWPRTRKCPRFGGVQTTCRFGPPIWPNDADGNPLSKEALNETLHKELARLALKEPAQR